MTRSGEYRSCPGTEAKKNPAERRPNSRNWLQYAWPVALVLFLATAVSAQTVPAALRNFLKQYPQFSNGDIRGLGEGKPEAKAMETGSGKEIALAGAIRIAVPADFFLRQFEDIVRFKHGQAVTEIAKFSRPPALADLADLHLDERDVEALRECRPGNCDVKLSVEEIEGFRKEMHWSEPNATAEANRMFRRILLQRVEAYLKSGNAALSEYGDAKSPVSLARESAKLLAESAYLRDFAPHLADCLKSFPDCDSKIGSFLYWSKEEYGHGLKPVVSVTQVMIDRVKVHGEEWTWEASKQIYADHYSEGSLGVTLMVEAPREDGKPSFYLVYLNRTRPDALGGFFSFVIRPFLRDKARDELRDRLERIRKRMERLYAEEQGRNGLTTGPHSYRSAVMGSTSVARRAGRKPASSAAPSSTAAARLNVSGSSGRIW